MTFTARQWAAAGLAAAGMHALVIAYAADRPDGATMERAAGSAITIVGAAALFAETASADAGAIAPVRPVEAAAAPPAAARPIDSAVAPVPVPEAIPLRTPDEIPPARQAAAGAEPAATAPAERPAPVRRKTPAPAPARASASPQAAVQTGDGGRGRQSIVSGDADQSNYRGRVLTHLARHKRYPEAARRGGVRGTAVVSFSIGATGQLLSVRLTRGTGEPALDREAQEMVRRAAPFPPIPSGLGVSRMTFTARLDFRSR